MSRRLLVTAAVVLAVLAHTDSTAAEPPRCDQHAGMGECIPPPPPVHPPSYVG